MQVEKIIERVKEILMWAFIAVIVAGIIYVYRTDKEIKRPGEIIYENMHK